MLNPSTEAAQAIRGNEDAQCWRIIEKQFNPSQQHHYEALFTLSNGYLGTRGSCEEGFAGDLAATFINGLYDDVKVFATELVNLPNWLPLTIKVEGEEFNLGRGKVLTYERQLDLQIGVLSRYICWRSPQGHTLEFNFARFVSLADRHIGAISLEITSVDFAGEIEITAGFAPEPQQMQVPHWYVLNQGYSEDTIWLHNQTRHSHIDLGMAATLQVRDTVHQQNIPIHCLKTTVGDLLTPTLTTRYQCVPGTKLSIEKIVSFFTSQDTDKPVLSACQHLEDTRYTTLLATHIAAWSEMWRCSDIYIQGDDQAQIGVRYNLFQLLAAAPRDREDVSIPPKALSGFVYRGHIFWDTEIFILPFLIYSHPQLAKNLLSYRYHTLAGARRKAQAAGYDGAMYAWESAATGDEVTPRYLETEKGELVRIWCGDIEVHISADIAYGV